MPRSLWQWLNPLARPQSQGRPENRRRIGFDVLEDRLTPATFTVNNATDTPAAGTTTLRQAINAATAAAGADTIVFAGAAAGANIVLTNPATFVDGNGISFFNITDNLTINGTGGTTISTSTTGRLFNVSTAAGNLSLVNTSVSNFNAVIFNGGAIFQNNGTINFTNVTISGNRASSGGGLFTSGGTFNSNGLTFNNNTANVNGGGLALSNTVIGLGGLVFTNNRANNGSGGGWSISAGSYSLGFNATDTGNTAREGGLFAIDGASATIGGILTGNTATDGGAISIGPSGVFANVTLNNATIRGNSASQSGGGVIVYNGSTLAIVDSLIGGATNADANTAIDGGGIFAQGALSLNRVTVANNRASNTGSGIHLDSFANSSTIYDSTISSNDGTATSALFANLTLGNLTLVNDTVAFNSTVGVLKTGGASLLSSNTIYANNSGADYSGAIVSTGNNLFGNSAGVTSGLAASDRVNVNPLLGPLAINGAANANVLTHALQAGSPALNAGNNATAVGVGLTVDERGSNRFVGTVDIGAYELIDTVGPTATLTPPPNINATTAGNNTTTIVVTYADGSGGGLESPSGVDPTTFGNDDITVSNGATVIGFSPVGNQVSYTVRSPGANWGVSPQGTYTISLTANGVRDRAGNGIAGNANFGSFVVDTAPPTATLTSPPGNINAANGGNSTNNFTVNFADATSGVDVTTIGSNDFVASNGATVTLFARVGTTATYTVTAPNGTFANSPQGTYTISLVAGSVLDNAGNPIAGVANFASFSVQTSRPYATLTTQPMNITVANSMPGTNSFTITYTSTGAPLNPATYGPNNVSVTNGGTTLMVISVIPAGNAVTYTVQAPGGMWTNPPQGQYTIALNGNSVFDTAGNAVLANPTLGFFTVDAYRPTPMLTSPPATINTNYTGPQSNTFSITYSDIGLGVDPSTFGVGNVTVTNGATSLTINTAMVSGNTVTYTALAPGGNWSTAPMGTYTIGIVANSVKDLAGNGIAANPNFAFFLVDLNRPTATLTTPPMNINIANSAAGSNSFTITYMDVGSGMNPASYAAGNVTVSNGGTTLAVSNVTVVGNAVTYTVMPPGGNWANVPGGTYTVMLNGNSVFDMAGNAVAANPNLATFTVDVTAPSVVVSPTGTLTNASPIVFTINFSEPVTGFMASSIVVTNGTPGMLTMVSAMQYTLPVTPTADGFVTVTVQAGAAQDAAGNPSTASSTASVESDRTGPIATFSLPSTLATTSGPVTYTITWTDPHFSMATLTAGQVILNTTGTANGTVTSVTGSGNMRVVTIDNIYGNGTISISLPPGTAVDTLGNRSPAAGPSTAFSVSGNRILNISQPPAPATLMPGTTYVYAIDYSNTGNQISPNARIVVNLPSQGVFVPAGSTPGWVNLGGRFYQFSLGNLAPGAGGRLTFAVNYRATTPPGTIARFTASIYDTLGGDAPVATSTVVSTIVNGNRLRWGRCCC